MTGDMDRNDAGLWRRWRDGTETAENAVAEPDAMSLAAYAENRLGRDGIDPGFDSEISEIEAWLADRPEALDDLIEARVSADMGTLAAPSDITNRAMALIVGSQSGVVILRPRSRVRTALAWSSVAASLVAATIVGFAVGMDDWLSLIGGSQAQAYDQDLTGPSTPLLGGSEEDGAT